MLAYIHIPYCDSKCHYCAFNSYVGKFDTKEQYMKALLKQTAHELARFEATKGSIETLFIGGGTPSTISPELYKPVFELLYPYLAFDAEITIEANPNSATEEWLKGMHELGANRVSIGVQSFDPDKLRLLGRAHSPIQAEKALLNADKAGFRHISLDLIYNTYGDSEELLQKDIKRAFELPVDHISAYELTIESGTPFAAKPHIKQQDDSLAFFVADEIQKGGFEHYEISNFGIYKSRHNLGYWQQKSYLGIGAGAVGFRGLTSDAGAATRFYPPAEIDTYLRNPLNINKESVTPADLLTEHLFLGLRSCVGISKALLDDRMRKRAKILAEEQKLIMTDKRYYNPNFFIADELVLFLLN